MKNNLQGFNVNRENWVYSTEKSNNSFIVPGIPEEELFHKRRGLKNLGRMKSYSSASQKRFKKGNLFFLDHEKDFQINEFNQNIDKNRKNVKIVKRKNTSSKKGNKRFGLLGDNVTLSLRLERLKNKNSKMPSSEFFWRKRRKIAAKDINVNYNLGAKHIEYYSKCIKNGVIDSVNENNRILRKKNHHSMKDLRLSMDKINSYKPSYAHQFHYKMNDFNVGKSQSKFNFLTSKDKETNSKVSELGSFEKKSKDIEIPILENVKPKLKKPNSKEVTAQNFSHSNVMTPTGELRLNKVNMNIYDNESNKEKFKPVKFNSKQKREMKKSLDKLYSRSYGRLGMFYDSPMNPLNKVNRDLKKSKNLAALMFENNNKVLMAQRKKLKEKISKYKSPNSLSQLIFQRKKWGDKGKLFKSRGGIFVEDNLVHIDDDDIMMGFFVVDGEKL